MAAPKAKKADNLTPKQEAFALAYVETGNASEAYRRAYDVGEDTKPETIHVKASEALSNGKVAVRVLALQQEARDRHNVTVDSLSRELDEARAQAIADPKGASAHVAAIMGKAKLHGLLVDKGEMKHGGEVAFTRIERTVVDPKN